MTPHQAVLKYRSSLLPLSLRNMGTLLTRQFSPRSDFNQRVILSS